MNGQMLFDTLAFPADGAAPALLADEASLVVANVISLFATQSDIAQEVRRTTPSTRRAVQGKSLDLRYATMAAHVA